MIYKIKEANFYVDHYISFVPSDDRLSVTMECEWNDALYELPDPYLPAQAVYEAQNGIFVKIEFMPAVYRVSEDRQTLTLEGHDCKIAYIKENPPRYAQAAIDLKEWESMLNLE